MKVLKEFFKALKIFCIICFLFFQNLNMVISADFDSWEKVASAEDGIQYIDIGSIKYKKDILSLLTKYSKINSETHEIINSSIYKIDINCDKRLFKIEGEKWEESTGNKFITETILNSCRY